MEMPARRLHLAALIRHVWAIALLTFVLTPAQVSFAGEPSLSDLSSSSPATVATVAAGADQLEESGQVVHVISPGETLYGIALAYGVDARLLARVNHIANPNLIRFGQRLLIPLDHDSQSTLGSTPYSTSSESTEGAVENRRYHTVRPGDTLSAIALEYGVPVTTIAAANNISLSSLIFSGQRLLIPRNGEEQSASVADPDGTLDKQEQPRRSGPHLGYGFCAHLLGQNIDPVLDAVQAAGFDWVRQTLEWRQFEPLKGHIDWQPLDEVVQAVADHKMHLVLTISRAPTWARPAGHDASIYGPPAEPSLYGDFLEALASRYRGRISAYEIWSEPNLSSEWGGKCNLSAQQYVALLREAYQRIKAADPDAIIISAGLAPTATNDGCNAFDDVHYLAQMYAAGAAPYFDVLGVHSPGYNNPPEDAPGLNSTTTTNYKNHWSFYFRRYRQLHDIMLLNGDGQKQLWFTELGWASHAHPAKGYEYAADNSEAQQAQYLFRAFTMLAKEPYVGVVFVNNLNYSLVVEQTDYRSAYSVIDSRGYARPAFVALRDMPKQRE